MRKYTVENINKPFIEPIYVYANTAKEAIKKVYRIENVKQDKSGNILVKTLINTVRGVECRSWVYSEVEE